MYASVPRKELKHTVALLTKNHGKNKKSTLPGLEHRCLLLQALPANAMRLRQQFSGIDVCARIAPDLATYTDNPGDCLVPAALLREFVNNGQSEYVTFQSVDGESHLTLKEAGENSTDFEVTLDTTTLRVSDKPFWHQPSKLPKARARITMPAEYFQYVARHNAVGIDPEREVIRHMLMRTRAGRLETISTNGRQLHYTNAPYPADRRGREVLVPLSILRLAGQYQPTKGKDVVLAYYGDDLYTLNRGDGLQIAWRPGGEHRRFPKIKAERFYDAPVYSRLTVDRRAALQALRWIGPLLPRVTHRLLVRPWLQDGNRLEFAAGGESYSDGSVPLRDSAHYGEYRAATFVDIEHAAWPSGDKRGADASYRIWLNADYLIAALEAIPGDRADICLPEDPESPIHVRQPVEQADQLSVRRVIMPLRVSDI